MRGLNQIGLLLLVLLTACHPSVKNEQSDTQKDSADRLSICSKTDTLLQIKPFTWEGKLTYILPPFWVPDSITAFSQGKTLSEQEMSDLLTDTSTKVMHSHLPVLFINMGEADRMRIYQDKSESVTASIELFVPDGTCEYEGEISIKTRGNTSFLYTEEKKSFSIKLDQSARLLGLEKGKSFTLVNNIMDNSFLCNALAFHLAKKLGIFAPDFSFITLYLNGNYLGIYQMTNKIEVGKRSVDIVDLEKKNKKANERPLDEYPSFSIGEERMNGHKKGVCISNPDDITGGYRLDCNGANIMYESCVSGFVSRAGDPVRIKSPKHASQEQVEYISNFYDQIETSVMNPTGYHPKTGKHYTEYLDIQSFARYFLIQEITENIDGGWCSFMMYKDLGDALKMVAGPAWDFDRGMRKSTSLKLPFNTLLTCAKTRIKDYPYSGGLLYWLWQHEDFQDMAKHIFFEELHDYLEDSTRWRSYADSLVTLLQHDAEYERMRFPSTDGKDYLERTSEVTDFLIERNAFLNWLWAADSSDIVALEIKGCVNPRRDMFEKETVLYGDKAEGVTLPEIPWEITFNRDPTFLGFYLCGSDSLVKGGTTFYDDQCVEIRWDYPNWFQIQYRRVRKKLKKLFHIEEQKTTMEPTNSVTLISLPQ